MNKKIQILLIVSTVAVFMVLLFESLPKWLGKSQAVFVYDMEEYKIVDDELILWREVRQIKTETGTPRSFAIHNSNIYLLAGNSLQIITPEGKEMLRKNIGEGRCLTIDNEGNIIVAFENDVAYYNMQGEELFRSELFEGESLFSSVKISGDMIFLADAGKKEVLVLDKKLQTVSRFKGESGVSSQHGFIVPSSHFDLAVNSAQELWIVNPGLQRIQNYSPQGRFRGHWGQASFALDGFSGCCNPFYIAFLSDGRVVTSEKGLVRVKVHKESGELESVVAAPAAFERGKQAPALAVDEMDNIWLLDFNKNMLRLFKPRND